MAHLRWDDHYYKRSNRCRTAVLYRCDLIIGEAPCMLSLVKSGGVQYYLDTDLPIQTRKHYGFLEPMKAEVTAAVEKWLALIGLHDASFEDGGGI